MFGQHYQAWGQRDLPVIKKRLFTMIAGQQAVFLTVMVKAICSDEGRQMIDMLMCQFSTPA